MVNGKVVEFPPIPTRNPIWMPYVYNFLDAFFDDLIFQTSISVNHHLEHT